MWEKIRYYLILIKNWLKIFYVSTRPWMPSFPLKGLSAWAVQEALMGPSLVQEWLLSSGAGPWCWLELGSEIPVLGHGPTSHTPPPCPDVDQHPSLALPTPFPPPSTPNSHGPPQPSKAVSDPSDHPWTCWLLQECARRHIGKDPVCLPIPASITCFPSPLPMQGSTCSSFSLAIA